MSRLATALLLLCLALPPGPCEARRLPASGSVEALFSPWDDTEAALIGVIAAARSSVLVQAYIFTSKPIARALIGAHQRGLRVEVLADAKMHQRPKGNVLPRLIRAGIPVAVETRYAAAHNKVLIIDADGEQPVVVTGSYNFTWSARHRNAENVMIVRDNAALAESYARNWARHRNEAHPVDVLLQPIAR